MADDTHQKHFVVAVGALHLRFLPVIDGSIIDENQTMVVNKGLKVQPPLARLDKLVSSINRDGFHCSVRGEPYEWEGRMTGGIGLVRWGEVR